MRKDLDSDGFSCSLDPSWSGRADNAATGHRVSTWEMEAQPSRGLALLALGSVASSSEIPFTEPRDYHKGYRSLRVSSPNFDIDPQP